MYPNLAGYRRVDKTYIRNTNTLVQLIVDCRKLVPDVLPDTTEMLNVIESKSRLMLQITPEEVILD